MKGMQAIRTRIRAVKNTAQITRAMELVASSKMKKAQDSALGSRLYACELAALFHAVTQQVPLESIHHPFLEERPVQHRGILLITPDKGLCGSLNQNLLRTLLTLPKSARFIAIGRKGVQFLSHCHSDILAHFNCPDTIKFQQIQTVVHFLLEAFENKQIDTIEVLFPRFKNTLVQEPTLRHLFPMTDLKSEVQKLQEWSGAQTPINNKANDTHFIIEPDGKTILERLPILFLKKTLYQILLEAKASEHSARMVAMKGATDNAESLIQTLQLEYNKARQAGITQEIVEISASQHTA